VTTLISGETPLDLILSLRAQRACQLKGWSRAKKEALIRGDYAALPELAWGWTKERRQ